MNQTLKDILVVGVTIFFIYFIFGTIWPRIFPDVKVMGDEHDLFRSEQTNYNQPNEQSNIFSENAIKEHLIGKKLRNSEWKFDSLDEFEKFEIESVSADESGKKIYVIKSVLKDFNSGIRYNSRFYIKYSNIQGQNKVSDIAWGKDMVLDVCAYSYEVINDEKDNTTENNAYPEDQENRVNTSKKVICPKCDGGRYIDNTCGRCKGSKEVFSSSGSQGVKYKTCPDCRGFGVIRDKCPVCDGKGRVAEYE